MRPVLVFALVLFSFAGSCKAPLESSATDPATVKTAELDFEIDPELNGIRVEISDGLPGAGTSEQVQQASTEPLSVTETSALLGRTESLVGEAADEQAFALREGSKPPPRTGDTVLEGFPPPVQVEPPPSSEPGALTVVRYAPEGEIAMAPSVSVTFSQPMVPLTSQDEAAAIVPARLEPQPPGQWRWLGTKTLIFEPEHRFPMATTYTMTVADQTASEQGATLDKGVTWTFDTPAPVLVNKYPTAGPQDLQPIVFLEFDQEMDPAALVEHIDMRLGSETVAFQTLSEADARVDETVASFIDAAESGRWIALQAVKPLPKASSVQVIVNKGAPSAEGPKTTSTNQSLSFRTYGPLQVMDHYCRYRSATDCSPHNWWTIEMSNPLDEEAFESDSITISPPLKRKHVRVQGNRILINGPKKGRTTYTVTIPADLKDGFGQTLGLKHQRLFKVGPSPNQIQGPRGELVTLDPSGPKSLSIYSMNEKRLRVRIHGVKPETWKKVKQWWGSWNWQQKKRKPLPGKRLFEQWIPVDDRPDELVETQIDLSPYLTDGVGHVLVWVEGREEPDNGWYGNFVAAWVQVTDLGVHAELSSEKLVTWVSSLQTGESIEGVEISVYPTESTGRTNAAGIAEQDLPAYKSQTDQLLLARRGSDVAILPSSNAWWDTNDSFWSLGGRSSPTRWAVLDDRGMYRPGEVAYVKGWVRRVDLSPQGDVSFAGKKGDSIAWNLMDSRGNEVAKGTSELSALGGFDLKIDLPKTMNLGHARLHLMGGNGGYNHTLKVQEFRRPEFEVNAKVTEGPHQLGTTATVTVNAAYFAGGGLGSAPTNWSVYATPAWFTPPNRGEYQFGVWVPWWRYDSSASGERYVGNLQGKTDPLGNHYVDLHFKALNPARPMTVRTEASVTDVNRQQWTARAQMLVHPSNLYVGLKTSRTVVEKEKPFDAELVVVDIDGALVGDVAATVRFERLEWKYTKGTWQEVPEDVGGCEVISLGDKPIPCALTAPEGGAYRILVTVEDEHGRPNASEQRVWVPGGKQKPQRTVTLEEVLLIPETKDAAPGETMRVLVQAPFFPAEGLMTLERNGFLETKRFQMESASTVLEIPIVEAHVPGLHLSVDLVGETVRTDDQGNERPEVAKRVAFATGRMEIKVPPANRVLNVVATPAKKALGPGESTSISVQVTDAAGAAVDGAELAVVVVDESVLALSAYSLIDPLAIFYQARSGDIREVRSRGFVKLADPAGLDVVVPAGASDDTEGAEEDMDQAIMDEAPAAFAPAKPNKDARRTRSEAKSKRKEGKTAAGSAAHSAPEGPIAVRSNFSAVALFAPDVMTDDQGRATVEVTLPDSLTRFRVMVVAVSGERKFGTGESAISVRLPLMLRPSPPRFLNFGDRFELSLVVQNQTETEMQVSLAAQATNLVFLDPSGAAPSEGMPALAQTGRKFTVSGNDRVEVRLPAMTRMAGTARVQAVFSAGDFADAARFELPVWTPATTEAFATYGEIDDGAIVQSVRAPADVWPQFGALEVTTSSTQLQALTDALIYLTSYPYDCNEQRASRILAVAGLRDVLTAFESDDLQSPEELNAAVQRDLDELKVRQNYNGGWSFWRRGDQVWPYPSVHIAHALVRAKDKGYSVDASMLERSKRFLRDVESHIPHWYSREARWSIIAFSLNVRHRMGDLDDDRAVRLLDKAGVNGLSLEAQGWILPVLHAGKNKREVEAIQRNVMNKVTETAGAAHFATSYSDGAYVLLHSNRRADAVLLEALIEVSPQSDLIPKIVRGLLAHRVRGRWSSTQENAFVLQAMDRYFHVYEGVTPDFVARAWLGDGFAGEHAFKGRTTESSRIEIPMETVIDRASDGANLVLDKDGQGRMYYRLGLSYAPKSLVVEPADRGFEVLRSYEAIDDPEDVTRDETGAWVVKAGARVRVRLSMVAPTRRYHVALTDPLPAGLEVMNPALEGTATAPEDPDAKEAGRYWWWSRPWYQHQNLRDERVEAFTTLLWAGVHEYTYVARATTLGEFVVPPTKAEEMYSPETFGRSGSDRLVVR